MSNTLKYCLSKLEQILWRLFNGTFYYIHLMWTTYLTKKVNTKVPIGIKMPPSTLPLLDILSFSWYCRGRCLSVPLEKIFSWEFRKISFRGKTHMFLVLVKMLSALGAFMLILCYVCIFMNIYCWISEWLSPSEFHWISVNFCNALVLNTISRES